MSKYRKKPVIIDAFQYFYSHSFEAPDWYNKAVKDGTVFQAEDGHYCIKTLEGNHYISDNDYVIRGVNGELYPCKPDIFEKTYEKVDD